MNFVFTWFNIFNPIIKFKMNFTVHSALHLTTHHFHPHQVIFFNLYEHIGNFFHTLSLQFSFIKLTLASSALWNDI